MYRRITEFIETQINTLGGLLAVGVFVLWFLAQFVPKINNFVVGGAFFNVVIIILLFEVLRRVVELKLEGKTTFVTVAVNQDEAWPEMQSYIRTRRPKQADMLEYSGGTAIMILEELCFNWPRIAIRILLSHPESALSKFEQRRIEVTLEYLRNKMSDHANISVKCYRAPASVRGRCFDNDLVNIGWYSYHGRRGTRELQGHLNAMLTATVATPQGRNLRSTFSQAFEDLWTHPDSVDGADVELSVY